MASKQSQQGAGIPLADHYEPASIESDIYGAWEGKNAFSSKPRETGEGFCILLPPPNVTGSLHMGHAFQHVVMDALTRHARMRGANTLWQPGTDHAGVGTHIVVSRALRNQGIDPEQLSRDEFLAKVLEWKDVSATTIGSQMRRLGDSCDWERECFTLDPALAKVVRDVFIRLYKDGLIYRGKRLVNWDPKLLTALADLEVVSEEEDGVMYHVRYPFADGGKGEGMVIATTRPETILVDGALAVAPGDERHAAQVGRFVHVPCTDRRIEIIEDEHVDPEFGSGCVKITAAHDFNDYEVAMRHPDKDIPILELLNLDASLNENAPRQYQGLDRYEARRRIVADLDAQGLLVKKEPHRYKLPRGERSGVVVEPMLSDQWYLNTKPLAKLALDAVSSGDLRFVPDSWRSVYENWLNDSKDWCISRQIDWGHQIPAWLDEEGGVFVAEDEQAAQEIAGGDRKLTRVPDVLDTWFSSALWPLSTLGWPETGNPHFRAYFPTSVLVTGNDIIFFWVARMVMMSKYLVGDVPFRDVYMHGLVRDRNGHKMSKSRGNVLDPIDLIDGIGLEELLVKRMAPDLSPAVAKDIEKRTRAEFPEGIPAFGADALRLTFASLASHGRNINFDLGRIDGHRRLCNKLWQAARFVLSAASGELTDGSNGFELSFADKWMVSRLQLAEHDISMSVAGYRLDLMVEHLTSLLRDDYCDWYIEVAKESLDTGGTRQTLVKVFAAILRLAHPVMPFITAKLWPHFGKAAGIAELDIISAAYPKADLALVDAAALAKMDRFKQLVHACRSLRASLGIDPKMRVDATVEGELAEGELGMLARLARLGEVSKRPVKADAGDPIVSAGGRQLQLALGGAGAGWRDRLKMEVVEREKECGRIERKLANSDFVSRAPEEVVALQRDRLERANRRLAMVKELVQANTQPL